MKEEKNGYQKFISKPEISFWVPIMITIISWAFFAGITINKLDMVIADIQEIKTAYKNVQARLGVDELNINTLLTIHPDLKYK